MKIDLLEWRHLSGIEEAFGNEECVYPIDDGAEDVEYPGDLDYYEVLDAAEALFRSSGIRLASYEDPLLACITPEGDVVGAVFAGLYRADEGRTVRFSAAVSPRARRQRVAWHLINAMVRHYKNSPVDRLEAWVVNPNMAALLEKMGFDAVDGEWSQDTPHMELWL